MNVRLLSTLLAGTLLVAGCGASTVDQGPRDVVEGAKAQPAPVVVRDAQDARAAVRGGRVVRPLLFDGGALRIDPAKGRPPLSELDAIKLVRASSPPGSGIAVSDVVVALGIVSLATPVTAAGDVVVPSRLPAFRGRLGWFVVYENSAHSCPAMTASNAPATKIREPLPVRLIAADGSGEGVTYGGAGSFCGFAPTVPSAHPSFYEVSVPWRVIGATSGSLSLEARDIPECAAMSGAAGPGWPDTSVVVGAEVAMVSGSCQTKQTSIITVAKTRDGSQPKHGATGLAAGMLTGFDPPPGTFTYFDGQTHTIR